MVALRCTGPSMAPQHAQSTNRKWQRWQAPACRMQQSQGQHSSMQLPQQNHEPLASRSAWLRRLAFVSAASAAASSIAQLATPLSVAAAEASQAAVSGLAPLGPVSSTLSGPRSQLILDPQLLPLPPGPIAFPRRQLDLNFAVLLMRSGYEACDDLDFTPMDLFQKSFWKFRQAEWEPYLLLHSPLRIQQGQLADPLYFDFIAFSQATAASNLMRQGKQVFEEYDEATEGMKLVTRDPILADNALLPDRFFERHGERMYRGLVEGFRGEQFGGPLPSPAGASDEQLLAGVQQILDIFMAKGYALKASLTRETSGSNDGTLSGFTVRLEGPANLWSLQALAARRSSVYQVHDAATVAAFLRASGRSSTCRLSWGDTAVTQQWSLQDGLAA